MRVHASLLTVMVVAALSTSAARAQDSQIDDESKFQSFKDYRGFSDEPLKSWQESNAAMERLGGHMGHVSDSADGVGRSDGKAESEPKHTEGRQP